MAQLTVLAMTSDHRAQPSNGGCMWEFDRACDVWKSFWQALEEEILALGGHGKMLERLAKKELRPAIRELAKAIVGLAPARVFEPQAPVIFDVQKAQAIWLSGVLWENDQCPYCKFTFQNPLNKTKLMVGISHGSNAVQVEANLVTLDCPTLCQSKELPHQHLMSLNLRAEVIGDVKYNEESRYVEFTLKPIPGMRRRCLCIYDGGRVAFSEW